MDAAGYPSNPMTMMAAFRNDASANEMKAMMPGGATTLSPGAFAIATSFTNLDRHELKRIRSGWVQA